MIKFSFNPYSGQFLGDSLSHAENIRRYGNIKEFDDYIRGIIIDDILYLRTFYPFNDIDKLTLKELNQKSYSLLYDNKEIIQKAVRKNLNIKELKIIYNATNDLLGRNI